MASPDDNFLEKKVSHSLIDDCKLHQFDCVHNGLRVCVLITCCVKIGSMKKLCSGCELEAPHPSFSASGISMGLETWLTFSWITVPFPVEHLSLRNPFSTSELADPRLAHEARHEFVKCKVADHWTQIKRANEQRRSEENLRAIAETPLKPKTTTLETPPVPDPPAVPPAGSRPGRKRREREHRSWTTRGSVVELA